MCTMGQCKKSVGQWVRFQTPWGTHHGVVADVNQRAVLMRVPRQYAPTGLANHSQSSDDQKLDVALAQWGGYRAGAYGGYPSGYSARWGYPGYGAWRGGFWWWWLAFAAILALALLW